MEKVIEVILHTIGKDSSTFSYTLTGNSGDKQFMQQIENLRSLDMENKLTLNDYYDGSSGTILTHNM